MTQAADRLTLSIAAGALIVAVAALSDSPDVLLAAGLAFLAFAASVAGVLLVAVARLLFARWRVDREIRRRVREMSEYGR